MLEQKRGIREGKIKEICRRASVNATFLVFVRILVSCWGCLISLKGQLSHAEQGVDNTSSTLGTDRGTTFTGEREVTSEEQMRITKAPLTFSGVFIFLLIGSDLDYCRCFLRLRHWRARLRGSSGSAHHIKLGVRGRVVSA